MKHANTHTRTTTTRDTSFVYYLFSIVVLGVLLVPSLGMLWAPTKDSAENRTLAPVPQLIENGKLNTNILADAGTYFEDHFAYRSQLITTNARLRSALGTSATDQVLVGTHGWLYYAGTLPDYLGQNQLSERELRNIAHNMKLLQSFALAHDAQFVFAVAPNKNSLYPHNMPPYILRSNKQTNWQRLLPYLNAYKVNYLDLFDVLSSQDKILYYTRDTHWNNEGALVGANEIRKVFGCSPLDLTEADWIHRNDYTGDVAGMLYPSNPGQEQALYAPGYNDGLRQTGALWTYTEGSTVEEDFVRTATRGTGTGVLVMFRDSFGNALIPYLAPAYEQAVFTKLIPYDAATISVESATHVVVERAERHLGYLAAHAPIMPAPTITLKTDIPQNDTTAAQGTTLEIQDDGAYVRISGELGEQLHRSDADIYLEVQREDGSVHLYETNFISARTETKTGDFEEEDSYMQASMPNGSDYGFVAYLLNNTQAELKHIRVIVRTEENHMDVISFSV